MIVFKKWAKHKFKSYINRANHFLRKKRHKKLNQKCKQKQSRLFDFCNIFDLLTSRTEKLAWWPLVFEPDFTIMSNSGKFKEISLKSFYSIIPPSLVTYYQNYIKQQQTEWDWKKIVCYIIIFMRNLENWTRF